MLHYYHYTYGEHVVLFVCLKFVVHLNETSLLNNKINTYSMFSGKHITLYIDIQ